jgi:hypothetical protein
MPRRLLALALVLTLVVSTTATARDRAALVLPSAESLGHAVNLLADPAMEGRGSGTPGGERAAQEIARQLAAAGVRPGGDQGSFFQSFPFAAGIRLAPESGLDLEGPGGRGLALDREWRPHGGSRHGEATGDIVFVGYGITSADGRWDDYRGVDVRDRIALALDGSPGEVSATRLDKLVAARRAGAKALLIAGAELAGLDRTSSSVDLVSASVTREAADGLLAPSGKTVAALEATIAAQRAPASFAVPDRRARLHVALARADRLSVNVIGVLPGTDPGLAGEAVVIGAHHDHVGIIDGRIHPGADDNASGTAVVLGLARAFAAAGGTPRTLVFALFGAEELGLIGSRHYLTAPVIPVARTVAMVNLDMVGRLGSGKLHIGGVDSGRGLKSIVGDVARAAGVDVRLRGEPFSPSDHVGFYRAGVPVLLFHTGPHDDYHKPTDTADRIDAAGMARVAAVAAGVIERLATEPPATYVKVQPPQRERRDRAGGAFLGIVADGAGGDGVRLAEIMPGSAAERAGVRGGDVIFRLAGEPVQRFEDLRRVIAGKKPGDTVELVYLRNGEDRTASAALGARP